MTRPTQSLQRATAPFMSNGRTAYRTAPPFRKVANLLTAAAAVLAMVLGLAVPARAEQRNNDLLKAIAAIATIALIAKALDKDKGRKAAPAPHPQPHPHPGPRPLLPATCQLQINGIQGPVFYGETCLRREGFMHRLPAHCARDVRIYGRNDRIYPEACLRNAGFRAHRR